jgi:alkylation response protein AidB-like acyl-CoA dehydrogenase
VALVAVDLAAPGVLRPDADADSLAFEDVAVAEDDIVGAGDQGWPAVQSVRARLRSVRWITSLLAIQRALDALADVGRGRGLADDAVFRHTLANLQVEADGVRALAYRALAKQGDRPAQPRAGHASARHPGDRAAHLPGRGGVARDRRARPRPRRATGMAQRLLGGGVARRHRRGRGYRRPGRRARPGGRSGAGLRLG